jgi:galactonate dehydratase
MSLSPIRITKVSTLLMQAGGPPHTSWGGGGASHTTRSRNWLFVKVETDAGITGWGEGSGWPKLAAAAISDLAQIIAGEDASRIPRVMAKMASAMQGHGDAGTPAGGAMAAIDIALWDISAKALGVPVWRLLGGKLRDAVPVYTHAPGPAEAEAAAKLGVRAIKCGGLIHGVARAQEIRRAMGPELDIAIDLHGPPWLSLADARNACDRLASIDPLFVEEPIAEHDLDGYKALRAATNVPLAGGERFGSPAAFAPWLAARVWDVVQPDTGRCGGISGLLKIAAAADVHGTAIAPHSGSLGPLAEVAAVHAMAVVPNLLLLERMDPDWEGRHGALPGGLRMQDGALTVPELPGLGAEPDEDFVRRNPSSINLGLPKGGAEPGSELEYPVRQMRRARAQRFREIA